MNTTTSLILAIALVIIMFGMGLSLRGIDFKRIVQYPKAIFVGLVNQLLILPLIGLTIASFVTASPEIAVGIMILAACPGGPTSNIISFMANGNLALSVSLTATSSLITILTIPFIVTFAMEYFIGEGQDIVLNIPVMITQIFVIVVAPVFLGMVVRRFKPGFASKMERPVRIASALVLAIIIIGLVIKERQNFGAYFQQAGLATLLLNVISMGIGYASASLFRLSRQNAVSISIESGIQNGTLAISIAVILLENTTYAIAPAVYSLLMFLTGGIMIYIFGKKLA